MSNLEDTSYISLPIIPKFGLGLSLSSFDVLIIAYDSELRRFRNHCAFHDDRTLVDVCKISTGSRKESSSTASQKNRCTISFNSHLTNSRLQIKLISIGLLSRIAFSCMRLINLLLVLL